MQTAASDIADARAKLAGSVNSAQPEQARKSLKEQVETDLEQTRIAIKENKKLQELWEVREQKLLAVLRFIEDHPLVLEFHDLIDSMPTPAMTGIGGAMVRRG